MENYEEKIIHKKQSTEGHQPKTENKAQERK